MAKSKTEKPLDTGQTALLEELSLLREAVLKKCAGYDSCAGDTFVVLRFCSGFTPKQWDEVRREHNLKNWLGFPLKDSILPFLGGMQRTVDELSYQSEHDPLTGLPNRRAFQKALDIELERSQRNGSSLSLAILDLDDFKKINDTYGHLAGDKVLSEVARLMLENNRSYDLSARIGGEEFAVILPGLGQVRAQATLERLLHSLRDLKFETATSAGLQSYGITASIGLSCTKGKQPITQQQLIDLADKALYKAKQSGKNRLEKAPIMDFSSKIRQTLVQADEKQFLFAKSRKKGS